MNNLNSVLIEGNIVHDPLHKISPKGNSICTFSIASCRFYQSDNKGVTEVNYFEIETWAALAEYCYHQGRKGSIVRVVGHLKQDRWNDSEGNARSKIIIVAEHVNFKIFMQKEQGQPSENKDLADSVRTSEPSEEIYKNILPLKA